MKGSSSRQSQVHAEVVQVGKEALSSTGTLLKIMVPISIIVKILSEFGVIDTIGEVLSPVMRLVGLPGEFGLVWATALLTNIYGGLLVFFTLSTSHSYTVAQVTVLATIILLAHTFPIELRIAQKAGVRLWFMFTLRFGGAFLLGWIVWRIFSLGKWHQQPATLAWNPGTHDTSLFVWIAAEAKNYAVIFLVIFALLALMALLTKTGIIKKLNNALHPFLRLVGMSKEAAPVTMIGMTLGLAYGGSLIIKEAKSGRLSKQDVLLSLSLMGLSHSLIEDTLLMLAIGASLTGILFARVLFTVLVMIFFIQLIRHFTQSFIARYFLN
jgi:hypothetical protein